MSYIAFDGMLGNDQARGILSRHNIKKNIYVTKIKNNSRLQTKAYSTFPGGREKTLGSHISTIKIALITRLSN